MEIRIRSKIEQLIVKHCDICAPICLPDVKQILREYITQKRSEVTQRNSIRTFKNLAKPQLELLDEILEELK